MLAGILWHVLAVAQMATADPAHWPGAMATHVEVVGFVTYVKREEDGDLHVRLCDSPKVEGMNRKRCVVAECIPALPCERPKIGARVTVRGVTRYDAEAGHGWWEIHPVLYINRSPEASP